MEIIKLGPWSLQVDLEATQEAYASTKRGGANDCGCDTCRNWRDARADHLPAALRRLFESLGIDFAKDVEIYEINSSSDGVDYGGWYAFVGRVLTGPNSPHGSSGTPDAPLVDVLHCEDIGDGVSVHFSSTCDLTPMAFQGQETASVRISLSLPWVVAKKRRP